jgi:hypothetical protein
MSAQLVPDVEALGVNPRQPVHTGDQIGSGSFNHQMKMVAHQAIGMHLPVGLAARFLQRGQEFLAVLLIQENVIPLVTSVQDMVHRPRIFDAQLPRHGSGCIIAPAQCH